jgi:hypothetical protein
MRLRERKSARCLPVAGIAGVQRDMADRLVLFMRDRRIIGASLDKSCNARDFYLGFYVEQTADGMLCAGRDTIHSRAGRPARSAACASSFPKTDPKTPPLRKLSLKASEVLGFP